jgi:hypothetical protein
MLVCKCITFDAGYRDVLSSSSIEDWANIEICFGTSLVYAGHYILESGVAKGTSSLQAYRVDSPAFQAWKPKPKLYFV